MNTKGNGFMKDEAGLDRPSSSLGMQSANTRPLASSLAAQSMYASLQQQKVYAAQQAAHFSNTNNNYVLEMTENSFNSNNNMLDNNIFKTSSASAPTAGGTLNQMLLRDENGLKKMGRKIENHQEFTWINRTNNNIITNDSNDINGRTAPISGDLKLKLKKKPTTANTTNTYDNKISNDIIHYSSNGFQQGDQFSGSSNNNNSGQLCRSGSSSSSTGQSHQQKPIKLKTTTTTPTTTASNIPKAISGNVTHNKSHSIRNSNSSFCNRSQQDRSLSPVQIQSRDGQSKSKDRMVGIKVVKKSLTPKKKHRNSKSKEGMSPGTKKYDNQIKGQVQTKQKQQQQQQQCLFQNQLIQDASMCLVPGSVDQQHHNVSEDTTSQEQQQQCNEYSNDINEECHRMINSSSPNATFSFRGHNTPKVQKNQKKSANKKKQMNINNIHNQQQMQQQQSMNRSITPERDVSSRLFSNTDNIQPAISRIPGTNGASGKGNISGNGLKNVMNGQMINQKRSQSRSKSRQRASSSQGGRSSSASKVPMNDSYNQQQMQNHRDIRKGKGEVIGARSKSQQGGKRDKEEGQQLVIANLKAKLREEGLKKKQIITEDEMEIKKLAKKKEIAQKNQDIRLMNAALGRQQQLLQTSSSQTQQFPWGVDQQKANRSRKDQSNSNNSHSSNNTKPNKNNNIPSRRDKSNSKDTSYIREASRSPESRDILGLQFINELTEDQIKKLLATQKIRVQKAAAVNSLEKENQRESNAEIQRQLQIYMQLQKRLKQMQQIQQEERDQTREIKKKNQGSNLNSSGNSNSSYQPVPRSRSSQRQTSQSNEQIGNSTHNRSLNVSEHVQYLQQNNTNDDSGIDYDNIHAQYLQLMHEQGENNNNNSNNSIGGLVQSQQQQLVGQRQVLAKDQQLQEKQSSSKPFGLAKTAGTTFYKTALTPPLVQTQNELVEQHYATVNSRENNNNNKNSRQENKKSSNKPQIQSIQHAHGDSIDELEEKKRQLKLQYSQIADRFKKSKTTTNAASHNPKQDHNHSHNDSSNYQYSQLGMMSSMNQALEEFTDGGNITIPLKSLPQFHLSQGRQQADQMRQSNSNSRSSNYHSTNTPPTHSSLAHSRPHSKLSDTNTQKQQLQQQQQQNSSGTPVLKKKTKKVSPNKKKQSQQQQQSQQYDKNTSNDTRLIVSDDNNGIAADNQDKEIEKHNNLMEYLRYHLTPAQQSALTPEQFQHLRLLWQQEQELSNEREQQDYQEELEYDGQKIEEEQQEEEDEEEGNENEGEGYSDGQEILGQEQGYYQHGEDGYDINQQYLEEQDKQDIQGVPQQQQEEEEDNSNYHSNNSYICNDDNGIVVISDEPFEIEELDTSNFSEKPYYAKKSLMNTSNFNEISQKNNNKIQVTLNGKDKQQQNDIVCTQAEEKKQTIEIKGDIDGEIEREEAESMSEMRRIEKEYQQQQLEKSTQLLLQSRSGKSQHRHQKSYGLNNSSSHNNIGDQSNIQEGIEKQLNSKDLDDDEEQAQELFEKKKQAARVILRAFRSLRTATLLQLNYQKYFSCQYENDEELYDQLNKGMQVGVSDRNMYDTDTDRLGVENRIDQNQEMHRLDHHFNLLLNLPQSEIKQYQQHLNSIGTDMKQFQDSGGKQRNQDNSDIKQEKLDMILNSSNKKQIKQSRMSEQLQQSQFSENGYDHKSLDQGDISSINTELARNLDYYENKQVLLLKEDNNEGKQRRQGEQNQVKPQEQDEQSKDISEILPRSEQKLEQSQVQQSQQDQILISVNDDDNMNTNNGNGSLKLLEKQFECVLKELNHSGKQLNNDDNGTFRVDFNDEEEENQSEGEISLHLHNDKYNTEVKQQPDMNATDTWRDSAKSSVVSQQKQQPYQQQLLNQKEELQQQTNQNDIKNIQNNKIQEVNSVNVNLQKNNELMEILNRQQVLQQDQSKAAKDSKINSVKTQGLKGRKNFNLVIKADEEEEREIYIGGYQQQQQQQQQLQQQQQQVKQSSKINQVQQEQINEDESSNLISELGIIEEWKSESNNNNNNSRNNNQRVTSNSNQQNEQHNEESQFINTQNINGGDGDDNKPRNRLYETDVQALAGTMLVEDSRQSTMQFQRLDWPIPSATFDASKLSSMIIGGQMKYQASEDEEQQQQQKKVEDIEQNQIEESNENNKEHEDEQQSTGIQNKKKQQQQENNQDYSDEDSLSQSNLKKRNRQRRPSRSQDWSDSELSSQSHNSSNVRSSKQSLSSTQKGLLKQQYESEISKIKQEEAFKWNQMISILTSLQNQGSLPKEAADQLNRLTQNVEKNSQEIKQNSTQQSKSQSENAATYGIIKDNLDQQSLQEQHKFQQQQQQDEIEVKGKQQRQQSQNIYQESQSKEDEEEEKMNELNETYTKSRIKQNGQLLLSKQSNINNNYNNKHHKHTNKHNIRNNYQASPNSISSSFSSPSSSHHYSPQNIFASQSFKQDLQTDINIQLQKQQLQSKPKQLLINEENDQAQPTRNTYAKSSNITEDQSTEVDRIFHNREQALKIRGETERADLEQELIHKRISPRSYEHRSVALVRWVESEQKHIQKHKDEVKRSIVSAEQAILKTKRDLEFAQIIGVNIKQSLNLSCNNTPKQQQVQQGNGINASKQSEDTQIGLGNVSSGWFTSVRNQKQQTNSLNEKEKDENQIIEKNCLNLAIRQEDLSKSEVIDEEAVVCDDMLNDGSIDWQESVLINNNSKLTEKSGVYKSDDDKIKEEYYDEKVDRVEKKSIDNGTNDGDDKDNVNQEEQHNMNQDTENIALEINNEDNEDIEEDSLYDGDSSNENKNEFLKISSLILEQNKQATNVSQTNSDNSLANITKTDGQGGDAAINFLTQTIKESDQRTLSSKQRSAEEDEVIVARNSNNDNAVSKQEVEQQQQTKQINQDNNESNKENHTVAQIEEKNPKPKRVILQLQGFKTNLNSIREYSTSLCQHILSDVNHSKKLLKEINTWLGPQPEEILKLLHIYDELEDEDMLDDCSYSTQPVLDGRLFSELERQRNLKHSQVLINQEQSTLAVQQTQDNQQSRSLERVHNQAIFEALNEALDYERIYGQRGKPFPWKVTYQKIAEKPRNIGDIQDILENAADRVAEWSSSLCGIIIDKAESHFLPGVVLNNQQIQQIKEDRLTRLLSAEVIENEEKWLQYDEEETEVQVELAQMVFETLIAEASEEYIKIAFKHSMLFPSQL